MADKLYFSRDAKVYAELTSNAGKFQGLWEIPVLDGFSFSQSTNQTEIGLTEMESTGGVSRRGRRLFTDSLAPAEWSFSTYMRPTTIATSKHHMVDQVLWAAMAGADEFDGDTVTAAPSALGAKSGDYTRNSTDKATGTGVVHDETGATLPSTGSASTTAGLLTFKESNRATLPKLTLYFVFETDTTNPMVYKLTSAIVNECSIDFDIDGIATANWSGFAKEVTDLQTSGLVTVGTTAPTSGFTDVFLDSDGDYTLSVPVDTDADGTADAYRAAITTGVTSTNNFIRNRLTQLEVRGQNPDVMEGKRLAVSSVDANGVITSVGNHGLKNGDVVRIKSLSEAQANTGAKYNDLNLFVRDANSAGGTFKVAATATGNAITPASALTSQTATVDTGIYSFTLTGGNITIGNNVTYLVPEEIGTINKPVEGVTGARAIGGNFTCYLVFDNDTTVGGNTGASADFFADLVDPLKGLTKVVNEFDVTFKVGGTVASTPRVFFNFPKVHIDVPVHSIEDVISLESNFGAYTEDFDSVDEFNMEVHGVSA